MPDGLYQRDILSWSKAQADLLRRLARGEKVNDIDWDHIVEEIEDVGISQLNAVRSFLRLMLVHFLKIHGWPDSPAVDHWRQEIMSFQSDALQRFTPSMRQLIDLTALYARALKQLQGARLDGLSPHPWPLICPINLDELLNQDQDVLQHQFGAASAPDGL